MRNSICLYIVVCFILFSATSCYECCNGNDYKFRVRIEIQMSHNDNLELTYINKNKEKFKVKGSSKNQFIEFCMNEEPTDLQFNFNKNTKDKNITIKSILLENIENQMFINKNEVHLYFKGNKAFRYNQNQNNYTLIKDQNENIEPSLVSRGSMKIRLKKRLKT